MPCGHDYNKAKISRRGGLDKTTQSNTRGIQRHQKKDPQCPPLDSRQKKYLCCGKACLENWAKRDEKKKKSQPTAFSAFPPQDQLGTVRLLSMVKGWFAVAPIIIIKDNSWDLLSSCSLQGAMVGFVLISWGWSAGASLREEPGQGRGARL